MEEPGEPYPYDGRTPLDFSLGSKENEDEFVANRVHLFMRDASFRDQTCGVDFPKCKVLYEEGVGDNAEDSRGNEIVDARIPRINMIKRALDEHASSVVTSMPDSMLESARFTPIPGSDPLEDMLRNKASADTERNMNDWVDTILDDSFYDSHKAQAAREAEIYGVGYVNVERDSTLDTEYSYELRDLVASADRGEEWSLRDAQRFDVLSRRVEVGTVDPDLIFWQSGVRSVSDKDMRRCTIISYHSTSELRRKYKNDKIQPGVNTHHYVSTQYGVQSRNRNTGSETRTTAYDDNKDRDREQTSIMRMYEKVKTQREIEVRPEGGEGVPIKTWITETIMTKTIIAGDVLLEYEEWDGNEGALTWPAIPHYVAESLYHPYGYSQGKALERSERFVNRCRHIMFRAGLKGARPNGFAIWTQNLGPDDRAQLMKAVTEGGPAFLEGNEDVEAIDDIRKIISPLNQVSATLDPALREAMHIEMAAFQMQSQQVDEEAMRRSRTGSGKRAQLSYVDRLRSLASLNMGLASARVKQAVYEHIRSAYKGVTGEIEVARRGRGRELIQINTTYRSEGVPRLVRTATNKYLPAFGVGPNGERQALFHDIEFKVNDTSVVMRARADGSGSLPADPMAREMFLAAKVETGDILPKTKRWFGLDRRVRAIDDMFRKEAEEMEKRKIQEVLDQIQASGGLAGGGMPLLPQSANQAGQQVTANGFPSQVADPRPEQQSFAQNDVPSDVQLFN